MRQRCKITLSSSSFPQVDLGKTRIYYSCGFQITSQVLLCMNSGRKLTSRNRLKWQRILKEKRCNKAGKYYIWCFPVYCISFSSPYFIPLLRQRIVIWEQGEISSCFVTIEHIRKVWKYLGFWKLFSIFRTVAYTGSVSWKSFLVDSRCWPGGLWILRESSWEFISFQQFI